MPDVTDIEHNHMFLGDAGITPRISEQNNSSPT
jgi:hypothetical protein